jgi:23S rRNA pseudouridine2604 synthase/16S rRNA pseudouridine516 synthase
VVTDKAITTDFLHQMAAGVSWKLGQNCYQSRPCQVQARGPQQFEIVLTQGLHRQIRYMCKALGYRVTSLQRTAIGAITLGHLAAGDYYQLDNSEVNALQKNLHTIEKSSAQAKP